MIRRRGFQIITKRSGFQLINKEEDFSLFSEEWISVPLLRSESQLITEVVDFSVVF